MDTKLVGLSKFLSLVLRHKPETIGLTLDANGWADVEELLERARENGRPLTRPLLERLVAENDKQRFALSEDGKRIRANQGHSIAVDLNLRPQTPPETLYHGTASRFVDSIREQGLQCRNRQHVHLSIDEATATNVGKRHGKPVILQVRAGEMHRAGVAFYVSENGVWLTGDIAPNFLVFPE
jgi:putative RNA 2'-phosphotransferase